MNKVNRIAVLVKFWRKKAAERFTQTLTKTFSCVLLPERGALLLVVSGCFTLNLTSRAEINAGPLFSQFSLTLEQGHRSEALGPLFYFQESPSTKLWAVPPLFSLAVDESIDSTEFDFLYPAIGYDRFGEEYRFHLIQLLNFSGGESHTGTNQHRFSLFPFYLQQRSPDETKDYTWVFPFYGTVTNRLLRDRIHIVAWPIYVQSQKRDVVTDNYLFPIFHLREGNGLSGWQVWPLIGRENRVPAMQTNNWGDAELVPGHRKSFFLWPFFLDQHTGLGSTNAEHQQALLPLYTFTRSPLRDSTGVPFLIGVTYTDDRGKGFREVGAPWPLFVFRRGEKTHINRVWPLFSHGTNEFLQSEWYLWPVYKYNRVHSEPLDRERTRILFFLYSDIIDRNTEAGTVLRRRDFWPLFTHRRDRNGNERLQVFALLEPILPNNKSIERNYSPLWSVWRSEKNPQTGDSSHSLLWNLFRRERTPNSAKTSLLFGLFQHQRVGESSRWRVFYVPFGQTAPAAPSDLPPPTSPPAAAE